MHTRGGLSDSDEGDLYLKMCINIPWNSKGRAMVPYPCMAFCSQQGKGRRLTGCETFEEDNLAFSNGYEVCVTLRCIIGRHTNEGNIAIIIFRVSLSPRRSRPL